MATDTKSISLVKASEDDAKFHRLEEDHSPGIFVRPIDHSTYHKVTHALANGTKIVDCDTHFTEPPDLFLNSPQITTSNLCHWC